MRGDLSMAGRPASCIGRGEGCGNIVPGPSTGAERGGDFPHGMLGHDAGESPPERLSVAVTLMRTV